MRYDPSDDPRQKIVTDFAAIAEVDILKLFCLAHELEYALTRHIPYTSHLPTSSILPACRSQDTEPIIGDMEAVVEIDVMRSCSHEWTDGFFQS